MPKSINNILIDGILWYIIKENIWGEIIVVNVKKCFIITPIGSEDDPIRRHIDGIINAAIKPALGGEYVVLVSHEMPNIGSITKQIISEIFESDLVIANLTNTNPNVMYELAFRHCVGKPTIQIAEKGTCIPFDIGTERTIPYQNDSQGVLELKRDITKFAKEIDLAQKSQGPIYDVLRSISYEDTLISKSELKVNDGDKDILRYLVNKIDLLDQKISANKRVTEMNTTRFDNPNNLMEMYDKLAGSTYPSKSYLLRTINELKKYKYEINHNCSNNEDGEFLMDVVQQCEKMIDIKMRDLDNREDKNC